MFLSVAVIILGVAITILGNTIAYTFGISPYIPLMIGILMMFSPFLIAIMDILKLFFPSRKISAVVNKKLFYRNCLAAGITTITSAADKAKAELIASNIGCTGYTSIEQLYDEGKKLVEADEASQVERENIAKLDALRKEESEMYEVCTKFSQYTGREKRIAILTAERAECLQGAKDVRNGANALYASSQQKEHDWAIHGGIASGIAGGAAGAVAASNVMAKNAQIRAQNEANKAMIAPALSHIFNSAQQYEERAKSLAEEIQACKIKLVADTSDNEVLDKLSFAKSTVQISDTGAFTVQTTISVQKDFMIYDSVKAVVDGTVSAQLYQENKLVGSALLVLPKYGIKNQATVKGICLSGAKKDLPYEIKYTAHHLWGMEI